MTARQSIVLDSCAAASMILAGTFFVVIFTLILLAWTT